MLKEKLQHPLSHDVGVSARPQLTLPPARPTIPICTPSVANAHTEPHSSSYEHSPYDTAAPATPERRAPLRDEQADRDAVGVARELERPFLDWRREGQRGRVRRYVRYGESGKTGIGESDACCACVHRLFTVELHDAELQGPKLAELAERA